MSHGRGQQAILCPHAQAWGGSSLLPLTNVGICNYCMALHTCVFTSLAIAMIILQNIPPGRECKDWLFMNSWLVLKFQARLNDTYYGRCGTANGCPEPANCRYDPNNVRPGVLLAFVDVATLAHVWPVHAPATSMAQPNLTITVASLQVWIKRVILYWCTWCSSV